MPQKRIIFPSQKGKLIVQHAENDDGRIIIIYGDPEGLRSLGELLIAEGNLDQKQFPRDIWPWDSGHHLHLRPGVQLHPQSIELVVQRLDGQSTGSMPDWFQEAKMKRERRVVELVGEVRCRIG